MQRNAMSIRGIAVLCALCLQSCIHTLLVPPRRAFPEHGKAEKNDDEMGKELAESYRKARNLGTTF